METSCQVVSVLPAVRTALAIGRGGAALLAASAVADKTSKVVANTEKGHESFLGISLSPEGKSVLFMAIAMSFHYLGYSLARPATVALFTSASTGYAGFAAAFPFAMAFVSPASLLMLMAYGNVLEKYGPRGALTQSTLFSAAIVTLSAIGIVLAERMNLLVGTLPVVKLISGPLFVFRESYVQLLTSQYWSFMASALTPNQSARWFGPIAGLTSITSAISGFAVSTIAEWVGLAGILVCTGLTLTLSLFFASAAYNIARKHGFEPQDTKKKLDQRKGVPSSTLHNASLLEKATKLFARVPVLGALFTEILASQGLATVLNICFVASLSEAIPNDAKRAGFVGVFFSIINVCTMVLQFGVLPPLMTFMEPRDLWRIVPVISCLFTAFQASQKYPSLAVVSASLLVMKVSEYSARRMLDEMIFVPLDFESRFLGKEVIGVFGYRFGKSL